ncbi:MAG: GDP-mannose 4,6-dehydratase [Patescibacteria group bacterium]
MNIVITGGAGFIGCNAAAYYLAKKADVIVFDNLSRANTDKNLAWLKTLGGNLTYIKGDLRSIADTAKLISFLADADAVLHLAAQVAVTTSVINPREDFEINAVGTFNLLEAMRASESRAKLIYSSTNKVYGGMEDVAVEEKDTRYDYANLPYGVSEDRQLDFHSPYGCSKGAADQYVHDYGRIYGLDTVVMRQSCIYGPRQFGVEDQGWVAWFIIATALGHKLAIYGDGKQVRDLLYVDDLIAAYDMAILAGKKTRGGMYNIGGGPNNTLSVWHEFGPMLEKLFGKKIPVTHEDWRPGDQKIFVADIRKAKKEFGWEPRVSVEAGIEKLYMWVSANKTLFRS